MPITLEDDLALSVIRLLAAQVPPPKPASAGAVAILTAISETRKLLLDLTTKVDNMTVQQGASDVQFQTEIAGLRDDMARQTSVVTSVKTFIDGLDARLEAAINTSVETGATPDELAAVQALRADLKANTDALAEAAKVGTVAQAEQPTPVEPAAQPAQVTGGDTGTAAVDDSGNQPAV